MAITRVTEFKAASGKSDELFDFLRSLKTYITSSESCESCRVLRSFEDEGKFIVIEEWDSAESHQKSVEGYPEEEMQAAMDLIRAPPKGRFYQE